jgi:hypothetical protein
VIGRRLKRLFDSLDSGIEVIVCNGCKDGTAEVVCAAGHRLTVIELDVTSMAEGLRAADRFATAFPRVYLDANVLVTGTAVHAVATHIRHLVKLVGRAPVLPSQGRGSRRDGFAVGCGDVRPVGQGSRTSRR